MNERVALLNIILLLAHESFNKDKNPTTPKMISDCMGSIKETAVGTGVSEDERVESNLKDFVGWMLKEGVKNPYDVKTLKSQLKLLTINNPELAEHLFKELSEVPNLSQDELEIRTGFYYRRVQSYHNETKFGQIFTKHYFEFKNDVVGSVNRQTLLNQLVEETAPYVDDGASGLEGIGAINSTLNMGDSEQFTNAFEKAKETVSDEGRLKLGLQGWNQALGGGIPRGAVIDVDALTGRGKSETLRFMLRTAARYNAPFRFFPDRNKAMFLYLTLEDADTDVIRKMYCDIVEEQTDEECDLSAVSAEEARQVVDKYFKENGYEFQIVYAKKHELRVSHIRTIVEHYERAGYEIMAMAVDYLQLLYYDDMPGTNGPTQVKNLIGAMEAITKPRLISLLTANQLDTKAKEIARFETEIAPNVVGKNMQENCKSITNEVDIEIATHIVAANESDDGYAYHQLAVGKNRTTKRVPPNMKYAVYRMHISKDGTPVAFIKPDIEGENMVRDKTAGELRSEGGGSYF